jgi:hypothetical protein
MKKVILIIFVIAIAICSFTYVNEKGNAIVEQQKGVYIFICSKPANEFEYLGSVSKSFGLTGQPKEMLNSILKKVKKDYPQANGVIFTSIQMDKADAILIK